MAVICPTVLALNPHQFREQIDRVNFAQRIQIDLGDGDFTSATVTPEQVYWPEGVLADLHLMYKRPMEVLETVISLNPNLAIVHLEAGGIEDFIEDLEPSSIRTGIALLQDTEPSELEPYLDKIDHVLVFSGALGSFGGKVEQSQIEKAKKIRQMAPDIEIGWDGGVNADNAEQLIQAGVDVLNVGGYIQKAEKPQEAYAILKEITEHN